MVEGASVVVVEGANVVDVVVLGVEVVVVGVVVVVVGTLGAFGVTATLLRSLGVVPMRATIQQRDDTAGTSVMIISARLFDRYVTSLRLKLITLFVGYFKVSASSDASSSSSSSFLFEVRLATHERRYDSGELSPIQDATSTF